MLHSVQSHEASFTAPNSKRNSHIRENLLTTINTFAGFKNSRILFRLLPLLFGIDLFSTFKLVEGSAKTKGEIKNNPLPNNLI